MKEGHEKVGISLEQSIASPAFKQPHSNKFPAAFIIRAVYLRS
ncbi:MAG: hypothetical protein ACE5G0_14565 [Rhodothermales bacterium]